MSDPEQDDSVPPPPWARSRRRQAPARVPLTRDRIVDAAYDVLDRDGFDRLSMRQVAGELGVAVSALYAHVASKNELLQLMYERLFREYPLPDADPEHWQEQLKEFARSGRARLLAHRDMAKVSMSGLPFTPQLFPYMERLIAIFRAAGLPPRLAATAGDLLATYTDAFVLEEQMWEDRRRTAELASWDEMRATIQGYFEELPPDRFPNLVELSADFFAENNDQRFDLGLEIILRGLASYIERPPGGAAAGDPREP
ncbi:transcriptional regulator [Sphaerisporangium rufum]|uniref:Transcriptional regulator n=1 Tax=Sphaerisporangium rufum TaxID=1381558 RepID=A0A919QZ68_9ACTN|nr:TetR/AcrR family transcriptional regulator [Sphaerisporangium rufum]GII76503.1 transcriptional regulator [Sphaerisporangium rufum]